MAGLGRTSTQALDFSVGTVGVGVVALAKVGLKDNVVQ